MGRITVDPAQMGGMPCIRSVRIPVATVVSMAADGMTVEILAALPTLEAGDAVEILGTPQRRYASASYRYAGAREAPPR